MSRPSSPEGRRLFFGAALVALLGCGGDSAGPDGEGGNRAPEVSLVVEAPEPTRLLVRGSALYWREQSDEPIRRIPLAGGEPGVVVEEVPIPEVAIARGGTTWWIGDGRLHRVGTGGGATDVVDEGLRDFNVPDVLALDDTHVYWVVAAPQNPCSPACRMTVRRVPRAGGTAEDVVTTDTRRIVDLEVLDGVLFWIEEDGGPASEDGTVGSQLRSRPLAGGATTTHVDGRLNGRIAAPAPGFIPASWRPNGGLAVDASHIYFGITGPGKYEIVRVPRAGGAVEPLFERLTGVVNVVRDVLVDGSSVFWIDAQSVRTGPKAGGTATLLAEATAEPADLDRVGDRLFWLETDCCAHGQTGSIRTVSTSGGTPTTVRAGIDAPVAISADAERVTWVEGGSIGVIEGFGRVASVLHEGSLPVIVAEAASGGPFDVDATHAYFANRFTIKRVPIAGGRAERLAIDDFHVRDLATDGTHVFWLRDATTVVRRMPVAGGTVVQLATSNGAPGLIRLDATHVYWSESIESIRRVPKAGGTVATVWAEPGGLTDFVVAGDWIYVAGWDDARIRRVPVVGGASQLLASPGVDQTRRLATDGTMLYWLDQSEVARLPVAGGTPFRLAGDLASTPFDAGGIALDATSVFWSEVAGGAIRRAAPR